MFTLIVKIVCCCDEVTAIEIFLFSLKSCIISIDAPPPTPIPLKAWKTTGQNLKIEIDS